MSDLTSQSDGALTGVLNKRSPWESFLGTMRETPPRRLILPVLAVAALTAVLIPFREQLGILNILLLFLLLTFSIALTGGLWPGVLGAILGFLAFDLFFIPPFLAFSVSAPDHVLALFVYLAVAIVTARLVSQVRAQTDEALREGHRTAILAELNAALIGDVTLDAILARIAERVVSVYGAAGCRVLVRSEDASLTDGAYFPPEIGPETSRTGFSLATWAIDNAQPVGRSNRGRRIVGPGSARRPLSSADDRPSPDVLYLPISTATHTVGVLEVIGRPGTGPFRADDEQLLRTFVDQAALALERARLSDEAAQAAALARSDELKSALLAAVSHDLRTPLASIKASATSLLDDTVPWDETTRHDFLTAIDEETDRLTLMVSNLLDLTRIEGGALRPQKDWYDVDELIADVRSRMVGRTQAHPVSIVVEPGLPMLPFDYVEIAQVLANLIENAVKYTPAGTRITIEARPLAGAVEISVQDDGPGVPSEHQERLFEKFYRADPTTPIGGAGIGLTISKGIVEAHGGAICVESLPGKGTTVRFSLPLVTAGEGSVAGPENVTSSGRERKK
jgi:two-component system sensor histidine kinase KdpD